MKRDTALTLITKDCSVCKESFTLDNFYTNSAKCKPCHKAGSKLWIQNNPEKHKEYVDPIKHKEYQVKKKYNITLEIKQRIFEEQGGLCKICKRPSSEFKMGLAIDHCHQTGRVRGLLCGTCNTAYEQYLNYKQEFEGYYNGES